MARRKGLFLPVSRLGTTTTNEGSGFVVHHLNEATPNPPLSRGKQLHLPVWDETSSSSSTSSNTLNKKSPDQDNSSMAQEQRLKALTKHTSSSSSVSVPICHGKQLIKLKPPPIAWAATSAQNKPPPVAWAATSAQNKHDDDLATTSSSSVHSGTQAFELLIKNDDLYFNMKQAAITNFPENNETQPTAQQIHNCNMGGNTGEDVTMEIHQSIEHQPIETNPAEC